MKLKSLFLLFVFICFINSVPAQSAENNIEIMQKGNWGKNPKELGISFPSPGVMPLAPFTCIGGFDIFANEEIWVSDSINQRLKCFKNGNLIFNHQLMTKMSGEIAVTETEVFQVVNGANKGIQIIEKNTGKQKDFVAIPFKNPGRISILASNSFVLEESGNGIWVYQNGVVQKHPSGPLEAVSLKNVVFGTQFNLLEDNRLIISSDLSQRLEQPEPLFLFEIEPNLRILYSKLCGIINGKPVLTAITSDKAKKITAYLIDKDSAKQKKQYLPIYSAPFLNNPWKLINGKFYTFSGTPKDGWKVIKILAKFID